MIFGQIPVRFALFEPETHGITTEIFFGQFYVSVINLEEIQGVQTITLKNDPVPYTPSQGSQVD